MIYVIFLGVSRWGNTTQSSLVYTVILSLLIKFRSFCFVTLEIPDLATLHTNSCITWTFMSFMCWFFWWHTNLYLWIRNMWWLPIDFWTLCVVNKHHQCLFASAGTVRFQTRKTLKEGLDQTQGIPGDLGEIGSLRPWLLLSHVEGKPPHCWRGTPIERYIVDTWMYGKKGYSRHSIR